LTALKQAGNLYKRQAGRDPQAVATLVIWSTATFIQMNEDQAGNLLLTFIGISMIRSGVKGLSSTLFRPCIEWGIAIFH
jgi:hypothetical protein